MNKARYRGPRDKENPKKNAGDKPKAVPAKDANEKLVMPPISEQKAVLNSIKNYFSIQDTVKGVDLLFASNPDLDLDKLFPDHEVNSVVTSDVNIDTGMSDEDEVYSSSPSSTPSPKFSAQENSQDGDNFRENFLDDAEVSDAISHAHHNSKSAVILENKSDLVEKKMSVQVGKNNAISHLVRVTPLKKISPPLSSPSPPPFPPPPFSGPFTQKIGYVCFNERDTTSVLESEGKFFRVSLSSFYSPLPQPFTPVLFSTSFSPSAPLGFGKLATFSGTFGSVYSEGVSALHPHLIEGYFVAALSPGRMTFCWNPQKAFTSPIKLTVFKSIFPSLKMDTEVRLRWSIRPPSKSSKDGRAFPFPQNFESLAADVSLVSEPTFGIPPQLFLEELTKHPTFNFHIGIGLPENEFFPTLSYSSFFSLHTSNSINWTSISRYIYDKYIELEKKKNPWAAKFVFYPSGEKSVLLFPGRWEGFGLKAAQELAQKILATSSFKVFVAVRAHPLSTAENVAEVNPQFFGNNSLSDIEERIFYNAPVGMGEEVFGEVCYNFSHNVKN